MKAQIGDLILSPAGKLPSTSVWPFEIAACLRTFGVAPGKLSTKKTIHKSPPGYYSIESSF